MTTCLGKSCSFGCVSWALVKFCVCSSFPFGIEGRMLDVIVLVPDHCIFLTLKNWAQDVICMTQAQMHCIKMTRILPAFCVVSEEISAVYTLV